MRRRFVRTRCVLFGLAASLVVGSAAAPGKEAPPCEATAAEPALGDEVKKWLDESIAKAEGRFRPALEMKADTLAEARRLANAASEKEGERPVGEWAVEYKGYFVFAHGLDGKPMMWFRGVVVKKGTRQMGRFGTW
jgi:hypothetical protein